MRPGILHPGRQRDCFSFDQLRARDIDIVVREVGPHICIKRDLPGRLLGGSQSGRGDATGGERQEGSAVEHDIPPWIDLPSILSNPDIPWCRRLLPYYWRRSSFAKRRRWQFMPAQRIAAT
jgi:hypothetical protein